MAIATRPIESGFAGEISGLDLSQPLSREDVEAIVKAIDQYAVVVFHGQKLSDDQQLAFAENFGELEMPRYSRDPKRRVDAKLADVSNLDANGKIRDANDRWRMDGFGNQLWHTDASFRRVPAALSMLYAHVVPPAGGETEFADLRAAYDSLSAEMQQRIEGLVAEHSIWHSRAQIGFHDFTAEEQAAMPPVPQRVVRLHPGSKRKTLYLAAHASHIVGWPVPEGRMLLHDLTELATQREFVYRHHWTPGDLVIWDNRCTMHRGRAYDTSVPRDLRRATTRDVASTLDQ
jgi:alpha-ketoglutarate-dependent 2,4-dichlorophenoxyacetate dioxygenase